MRILGYAVFALSFVTIVNPQGALASSGTRMLGTTTLENWDTGEHRRTALHNFDNLIRFGMTARGAKVRELGKVEDFRIAHLPTVKVLTESNPFSAIVVVKDGNIVFERYATDFGPNRTHSCQSTTKSMINLLVGKLVEEGKLDLTKKVKEFIPQMGTGYADATIQQVIDMDVVNDYTEGYGDPNSPIRLHEAVSGWRPARADAGNSLRDYLTTIASSDITNKTGKYQYKSTNTDVAGWIVERAAGTPLRDLVRDILVAAGTENVAFIGTDSTGFPGTMGSMVLTARDFARYGMLFLAGGIGVNGEKIGSADFIKATLARKGAPMSGEYTYSNSVYTDGRTLAHAGWGGQYLYVDPKQNLVVAYFSTLQNDSGLDVNYAKQMPKMAESISAFFDAQQ